MSTWTPQDWTSLLTAVGVFVGVVLSAVSVFLGSLAKLRGDSNGRKIDDNTTLTKAVGVQAATNSKAAAVAAAAAVTNTKDIAKKLNGQLEDTIANVVKQHVAPLLETMQGIQAQLDDIKNKQVGA